MTRLPVKRVRGFGRCCLPRNYCSLFFTRKSSCICVAFGGNPKANTDVRDLVYLSRIMSLSRTIANFGTSDGESAEFNEPDKKNRWCQVNKIAHDDLTT